MSTILSGLPLTLSLPVAFLAVFEGVRLGRRELHRPGQLLVLGRSAATLDGSLITDTAIRWRGPMAFMRFRDARGRRRRLVWWPDTLDARGRRELRLAVPVQATAHPPTSMAT